MQFDLSDEQKMLADSVRALASDVLAPDALVPRFDEGGYAASPLWPGLKGLGIAGVLAPESAGGFGGELLTLCVAAEALGHAGGTTPLLQQALAAWVLGESGRDAAALAPVLAGDRLAAFALCEPPDIWEPEGWTLAGPRLTGAKIAVVGAGDAGFFIAGGRDGALFLVEAGSPGVEVCPRHSLDRTRPLADLTFAGAEAEALDGPPGIARRLYDAMLVLDSADALGAARRALDLAVDYAKTRIQFDRPIGSFQGLKHQLANAALDVEPCRALVWYAAHAWDRGLPDAARAAALANAHLCEVAVRTARVAVEAHGGIGYTWDYPLHLWLKRAIAGRAHLGGPARQRARAAALGGW